MILNEAVLPVLTPRHMQASQSLARSPILRPQTQPTHLQIIPVGVSFHQRGLQVGHREAKPPVRDATKARLNAGDQRWNQRMQDLCVHRTGKRPQLLQTLLSHHFAPTSVRAAPEITLNCSTSASAALRATCEATCSRVLTSLSIAYVTC